MATIFIISDLHFGHESILHFNNGKHKLRDFESVEEMDEHIITRINSVVTHSSHLYILGDVAIKKGSLGQLGRLNGHKRLVRGNHDIFPTHRYMQYFDEIHGVRVLDDMVFTHIPIHPLNMKERWLANVHGHIHNNLSDKPYTAEYGPKYFNASCEVLNYVPLSLEQIKSIVKEWQT